MILRAWHSVAREGANPAAIHGAAVGSSCCRNRDGNGSPIQNVGVPALLSALRRCVESKDLQRGKKLHQDAVKVGLLSDIRVGNCLVDMYGKCGSLSEAETVFNRMESHNVVSWTALIHGYATNGQSVLALDTFSRMQRERCAPDARTFLAAFKACANLALKEEGCEIDGKLVKLDSLEKGMAIHSQAERSGCMDVYASNNLVDLYARCGSMLDARMVFDRVPHRNAVSWTTLIMGYAENEECELALELFWHMQSKCSVQATHRTFVAAVVACANMALKEEGRQVEGKLVKTGSLEKGMILHREAAKSGFETNEFVANNLIELYANCGSLLDSRMVFDRMLHPTVVSWTSLLMGYVKNGESAQALELFAYVPAPDARAFVAAILACSNLATKEDGKQVDSNLVKVESLKRGKAVHSQAVESGYDSDIFLANTLIDMYGRCGSMVDARAVFDKMRQRTVVSWNALMTGYAENGEAVSALTMFARMKSQGFAPNSRTFVAALMACGSLVALETGRKIHAEIRSKRNKTDPYLETCLLDFYGKCGSLSDAEQVFESLPTKTVFTWSALMAGYSAQGDTERVFDLFQQLKNQEVKPDRVTFLSILTACRHAGMVDKGKEFFRMMTSEYGVEPEIEHYHCMIDLLGRSNHLEQAVEMVNNMPYKPTATTWITILGACRKWKNVQIGELAFRNMLRLDEKQASSYLLMANIYGRLSMWEEQAKITALRKNMRAYKKPGQSWWTDEAGNVHLFKADENRHLQNEEIQAKLKDLQVRMKEEGYVVDLNSVVRNISDAEKEDALCGHSERLAIACALINTPPATAIRIGKNLRVCDDCHRATAIISRLEQRVIICRDASRFHVFQDGGCSCMEFW